MFIDSHCHLNLLDLSAVNGDLSEVLNRAKVAGVSHFLCPGVTASATDEVIHIAETFENVYAAVGVHPDEAPGASLDFEFLAQKAKHPKVIAIGETGLDYYRLQPPFDWQQNRFRDHIHLAKHLQKPLIIHTRAAAADTLRILKEENADAVGGVFHCFTEDWDTAKAALDLGFYISISGIVTFKNADGLRDVVKRTPKESILIETDSPYLAPVPFRGKPNEPAFVCYVAEALAKLWHLPLTEVAEITTINFRELFKL